MLSTEDETEVDLSVDELLEFSLLLVALPFESFDMLPSLFGELICALAFMLLSSIFLFTTTSLEEVDF